jgi:hypothetical protein
MSDDAWNEIEDKVDEAFPSGVLGLIWWRYCHKCHHIRPPRAHHCSICDACVMRMDHHCPWVGNCVGIGNHKLFWNFLLHAMMGCIIVASCMLHAAYRLSFSHFNEEMHFQAVMFLSIALIFSLGGLFGMHTYLLLTNQSTLEMEALFGFNPFARTKKVQKSRQDK